ncbi:hypothetical protein [Halalkalibacter nanhaiisediminis]|uniref:Uncharacterized protein n=1 Tax=Halalkalibacter nanhaiisediminis TaxID=688079 RepID=A0A562QR26_9BACI|nr:hypothetical protein [Halalkalibacter nanhaiisediminis]TWI59201.1 hypothetical protein IQ10_00914 [Halalkalibacter nanhaiisediminis]
MTKQWFLIFALFVGLTSFTLWYQQEARVVAPIEEPDENNQDKRDLPTHLIYIREGTGDFLEKNIGDVDFF